MEKAIEKIVSNWEKLKDAETTQLRYSSKPQMIAVWCAKSDTAGSYEVDEEWIGITPQGKIAWAYASGCSCWDGDFDEGRFESMKEVVLTHKQHLPEDWGKAIISFSETGTIQDL